MGKMRFGVVVLVVLVASFSMPVASALAGGSLKETGQTTPFTADKNDGIVGAVAVPDDGTLQRGASIKYKVKKGGPIQDIRTGLIWEILINKGGRCDEQTTSCHHSGLLFYIPV